MKMALFEHEPFYHQFACSKNTTPVNSTQGLPDPGGAAL
jgi:hypothetical protein